MGTGCKEGEREEGRRGRRGRREGGEEREIEGERHAAAEACALHIEGSMVKLQNRAGRGWRLRREGERACARRNKETESMTPAHLSERCPHGGKLVGHLLFRDRLCVYVMRWRDDLAAVWPVSITDSAERMRGARGGGDLRFCGSEPLESDGGPPYVSTGCRTANQQHERG
eukprot:700417-Rhodomonas_salina.2